MPVNEVTKMGLFDVFSKGGKYFGKAIEPKCEYCEFGKRSSDGDKVLCTKKGMVDASFHCPKFMYSPLKRIPVKQLERVGWLEGDYDEKNFDEVDAAAANKKEGDAKKDGDAKNASAPQPEETKAAAEEPAPAPKPAPVANDALNALAQMAESAGEYTPEASETPQQEPDANGLSSM